MTRFLPVFCLALALGACQSPAPVPDDIHAAYQGLLAAGDADGALQLLKDAAPHDVIAHGTLGYAYERGYLSLRDTMGGPDVNLPIRTFPGQAALEGWRFERHVNRAARAGDPEALLMVARRGAETMQVVNGRLVEVDITPAQRDTARAIYHRLLDTDVDRFRLAFLAQSLGDTLAYRRHVTEAAAAGNPTACTFKVWFEEDEPQTTTSHTDGLVRYFDRVADCRPGHPIPVPAMDPLHALRAQRDLGNAGAVAILDSLARLDLFERYPELAEASANPAPSVRS